MDYPKTFRTKLGHCLVFEDKIVLTKGAVPQDVSGLKAGNKIGFLLFLYAGFATFLFLGAIDYFKQGQLFSAFIFFVLSCFLVVMIVKSRNNSSTPVIVRRDIVRVDFVEARKGMTRSYFKVQFNSSEGKTKIRLIMLPGSLSDGSDETQKALRIFREENFIQPI